MIIADSISVCSIETMTNEEMLMLIQTYAYAINFYSLRTDLMEYYKGNIEYILAKLLRDKLLLQNLLPKAEKYSINMDVYNRSCLDQVLAILE